MTCSEADLVDRAALCGDIAANESVRCLTETGIAMHVFLLDRAVPESVSELR
jgi:hypothetical protein